VSVYQKIWYDFQDTDNIGVISQFFPVALKKSAKKKSK